MPECSDRVERAAPQLGVMIYWHLERTVTCIYSQLRSCTSSKVATMITGVIVTAPR